MNTLKIPINTFSLRYEAQVDIARLLLAALEVPDVFISLEVVYPEEDKATFQVSLNLEAFRNLISTVPDGHVMEETVAAESVYTGERTYNSRAKR